MRVAHSPEKKLVNPEIKSNQDVLNFEPALDHQFAGLATVVGSSDAKPTASASVYLKQIQGELAAVQAELKAVLDKDLADFNQEVRNGGIPPVIVVPRKKDGSGPYLELGKGIRILSSACQAAVCERTNTCLIGRGSVRRRKKALG